RRRPRFPGCAGRLDREAEGRAEALTLEREGRGAAEARGRFEDDDRPLDDARGQRRIPSDRAGEDEQPRSGARAGYGPRDVPGEAGPRFLERAGHARRGGGRQGPQRGAHRRGGGGGEEAPPGNSHGLKPSRDEAVDGHGRVLELLVAREAVARLHLGDQPAVVADLLEGLADRLPVVVAEEEVRVDALLAAA